MDELARYNMARWNELARANIKFSRPALDLDVESAREMVDPEGMMGNCRGKRVLCLAAAGGQQSAAFALLGASVTVFDFCETMLDRDRETARHYGVEIETIQGDMRDLSALDTRSYDIVFQAHSINFVPDTGVVFREISRVIRIGGLFRLNFTNPFIHGTWEDDWDGNGYPISHLYADGELFPEDDHWYFEDGEGNDKAVRGPREFRHTLSTIINEMTTRGFVILGFWEDTRGDVNAPPGTWDHYKTVCAPWLTFWSRFSPKAFIAGRGIPVR